MDQTKPAAPQHSHPDVVDATRALQALMLLALRRTVAVQGQAAADALLHDVESGKRHFVFTLELQQADARICAAASNGGELEPLLNLEIGMLQVVGMQTGKDRAH